MHGLREINFTVANMHPDASPPPTPRVRRVIAVDDRRVDVARTADADARRRDDALAPIGSGGLHADVGEDGDCESDGDGENDAGRHGASVRFCANGSE
jgi:hypothetical protein